MGLYRNLTFSSVKRKQAFSNLMSPLNVLSSILPGEKIEDFHFKAVFSGILNTTYGCSIIVFSLSIWYMCGLLKTLHPDSHGMKERSHNGLCLSHRAGEGFAGLPAKIVAYLVNVGGLLCLEFLYGWRFLNKISLDWPLTLTTQSSTSKLSNNPGLGPLLGYPWLAAT